MKHTLTTRMAALGLALCLLLLPTLSRADTYLPDGDVTHVDFTLGFRLHADAFPPGKAHLTDWETFLQKVDLRGSMDSLAMLTPTSRVYLNGAIRLNGQDQIPFVYDGYHSYRYLITPALANEVMFFQMHNFLEFMLKPYYYMELPTEYLGLLMYPEAAYAIGDAYYTPLAEMLESAREAALDGETAADLDEPAMDAAGPEAVEGMAQEPAAGAVAEPATIAAADAAAGTAADAATATAAEPATAGAAADDAAADTATATADEPATAGAAAEEAAQADEAEAGDMAAEPAAEGYLTYTVPYEDLYEQCENLDLIVNEDPELERAYFFFTCLLTEIYASDMTLTTLGDLEGVLDTLDPDQNGMTVTETPQSLTCTLGDTDVLVKTTDGDTDTLAFTLPTPDGYTVNFAYSRKPQAQGADVEASLTVLEDETEFIVATAKGLGLPREGELSGEGTLTLAVSGTAFDKAPAPLKLGFRWSRHAAQKPYALNLTVDWLHPATDKPAVSMVFSAAFSAADKSVFVEGSYPQNDFFNLNETFLEEYKERLLPSLTLSLVPFLLETPAGVINDLYDFADRTNILVSFAE